MNKETKGYIKNVMRGRDFIIDCISAVCSVVVLALIVINSFGDSAGQYYVEIFTVGTVLAMLNALKKLRARSSFSLVFLAFGILLGVAAYMCYRL